MIRFKRTTLKRRRIYGICRIKGRENNSRRGWPVSSPWPLNHPSVRPSVNVLASLCQEPDGTENEWPGCTIKRGDNSLELCAPTFYCLRRVCLVLWPTAFAEPLWTFNDRHCRCLVNMSKMDGGGWESVRNSSDNIRLPPNDEWKASCNYSFTLKVYSVGGK